MLRRPTPPFLPFACAAALALLLAAAASAGDSFLTIGGGYSPSSNQLSLERNVLYFQRVLNELGLGDRPHHIYFADGDDDARDLQYLDYQDTSELHQLLAAIMEADEEIAQRYRSHEIPKVTGPANVRAIDQWFDDHAPGPPGMDQDRLILYFTGHGGKARERNSQNTRVHLWGDDSLTVSEFCDRLDRLPPDVPVVLVMVQCYSGGFANVIFKDGDPRKGLDDHARAGFFATIHSRPAAGCTPDIDEANYQEYSSYFFAALLGENRVGEAVDRPDYDRDGRTSFAEAHGYALLASDSIDISIKTSDALLRHFSRTAENNKDAGISRLMPLDTSYRRLLGVAGPAERAVLEGLSKQLGLRSDDRTKEARKLADDLRAERRSIDAESRVEQRKYDRLREALAEHVTHRWPELSNGWHPHTPRILDKQGSAVLRHITTHPSFDDFEASAAKLHELDERERDFERKWVKTQRFLYVLESVTLAVNLPKIADDDVQARYEELLALENQTLQP